MTARADVTRYLEGFPDGVNAQRAFAYLTMREGEELDVMLREGVVFEDGGLLCLARPVPPVRDAAGTPTPEGSSPREGSMDALAAAERTVRRARPPGQVPLRVALSCVSALTMAVWDLADAVRELRREAS